MKIKQYIPNVCTDCHPKLPEVEFESYEELIEISWVNKYSEENNFIKFSFSDYTSKYDLLMAEYDINKEWRTAFLVVGYLSKDCAEKLNLSRWEVPK